MLFICGEQERSSTSNTKYEHVSIKQPESTLYKYEFCYLKSLKNVKV